MDIILKEHRKLDIVRRMTIGREEYLDYVTFKSNERTLYRETLGPLNGVKELWKEQGATDRELDLSAFEYNEALIFDCGAFTGYYGPDQSSIIENNDENLFYTNYMGIKHQLIKVSSTLGHPLDFPVKDRNDWKEVKQYYEYCPQRIPENLKEIVESARAEGQVIQAGIPGGFDEIRVLMGDEMALMGPYLEPDLIREMLDTIGETASRVLDEVSKLVLIDEILVHEDMAGKSGPLWGPSQVEEFMVPYYQRCWNSVKDRGTRVFNMDSDGDCNAILPSLIKGGINMFHPCEPEANMDLVEIMKKFGTSLAIEGGIDKYALLKDKDAIDQELERVVPFVVANGGCVLGLDHRIPNGVSLENYKYYMKRLKEIIARERGK
jgi:hypothetical protein